MSRYIDADALREKVLYHADTMNHAGNHEQAKAFNYCLCMIDDAPTAGRKRGEWIPIRDVDADNNRWYECSQCHHGDCHGINVDVPYCWYCGADMRGDND